MGGYHLHPRTGLATEYLGEDFMEAVRICLEEGDRLGMRTFLYDEDRWPSGAAGGLVAQVAVLASRYLRFTKRPYGTDSEDPNRYWPSRNETGTLMAVYKLDLDREGYLTDYRQLEKDAQPGPATWFVYSETWEGSPWFGGNPYIDTLNVKAVQRFLEVTHERYRERFGADFGKRIPTIFTDEPQVPYFWNLDSTDQHLDTSIPFSVDIPETFQEPFWERLPELLWDFRDSINTFRYRYIDHVTERFNSAFSDTVGEWCSAHGIGLTGHMMEESSLVKQTRAVGEAMRAYRSFQVPGIDMLCDWNEFLTAKQCQSAVRQCGREGMTSELYGVTNWDFDFAGHKRQGDWQAALGVTLRVHHLNWLSMEGESKRDYPAPIGYQSPWFKEYPIVEDHFARLNAVLTRGKPICRVAVIHPIESCWLEFGNMAHFEGQYEKRDRELDQLIRWLLFGLVDFDFVSESLLPSQFHPSERGFQVGEMHYDRILLPNLLTLRQSTLEILSRCVDSVTILGASPTCLDGAPAPVRLPFSQVPFDRESVLRSVEEHRLIDVCAADSRTQAILYQLREEGGIRYLFLCNTSRLEPVEKATIRIRGSWTAEALNTLDGTISPTGTRYEDDWTELVHDFPAHGSLLLRLQAGVSNSSCDLPSPSVPAPVLVPVPERVAYRLNEPNVLLLDQATYRVGEGPWREKEETLRIENVIRAELGLKSNDGQLAQPWTDKAPPATLATVELEFTIESKVLVYRPELALEQMEVTEVWFDGEPVPSLRVGYFVDESIGTMVLPDLQPGIHTIRLRRPFTHRSTLEWCYLLGDFGVEIEGTKATLTSLPETLTWGDWTRQGLPFYGGNVTYLWASEIGEGEVSLRCPDFKAPLLRATCGEGSKAIAFAPFEAHFGPIQAGLTEFQLTAYGSRINTFGQVHCADLTRDWWGPDSWRTTRGAYTTGYRLRPCGVLQAPVVKSGVYLSAPT